jgi:hypothetical protein
MIISFSLFSQTNKSKTATLQNKTKQTNKKNKRKEKNRNAFMPINSQTNKEKHSLLLFSLFVVFSVFTTNKQTNKTNKQKALFLSSFSHRFFSFSLCLAQFFFLFCFFV